MKKNKSIHNLNLIEDLLINSNFFEPNQKLVVTISGGQDSIFLLIFFFLVKEKWNSILYMVHCNHLWEEKSFYLYYHLAKLSYSLNIHFVYCITLNFLISEEKGRYWRSKNYFRLLFFSHSLTLINGHTLTDHSETFLFNTIRGSNVKGSFSLKKINFLEKENKNNFYSTEKEFIRFLKKKKNSKKTRLNKKQNSNLLKKFFSIVKKKSPTVRLLRPLIKNTRFDTKNICNNWKLPLFPDQSNQEIKYCRNRIRKQILPCFRLFINPKIDMNLYKNSKLISEEEKFLEKLVIKLLPKLIYENKNTFFFNTSLFYTLEFSLQRRFCLILFKEILKINYNFLLIDSFIIFFKEIIIFQKKKNKAKFQTKSSYSFFPEIGTFYFSEKVFLFLK